MSESAYISTYPDIKTNHLRSAIALPLAIPGSGQRRGLRQGLIVTLPFL